ncbi:MAG TPA: CDP-alcohol phosphatidyltransferase family protein [bacterium]|nr:CDP-alcohol phosphatidyltransferase family protein [bacterium]HNZ53031.1 CDP-alcohol phosphatidyltransferase family protein [bacterium]HOB71516.1 CDP-alcohol phosphatidyltransferase family protein [bacterium]HOG43593.1 CDP-alcohol phosphatidyltransferase family protein [bacterium]HPA56318.1 CDP-alcohol phosphatidyltransferase family protein [bacterium]
MSLKHRWMKLRNFQSADFWAMVFARPLTILFLFPVIEKKWVTPNRVTFLSVITKIAGAGFIAIDMSYRGGVIGAVLVNLGLILDNMDGTIARYHNTASKFGFFYDKATDAVTMTIMFWAMGYRGYLMTGDMSDLIIPLLAATCVYITGYSKWVAERVLFDMKISEKFHKSQLNEYAADQEQGYIWTPPPQRSFTDWLKWLGKAFFSILYFNEVDIFFWAGLALITEEMWIFTKFDSGFMLLGLFVGPFLFGYKVRKKERELIKLKKGLN